MQTLRELTELSMGLARVQAKKAQEAAEAEAPPEGRDPSLVFAQVARAVRQSIALEARLSRELEVMEAGPEDAQAALSQRVAGAAQRLREKLKDFILRDPPTEGVEALERERLEDGDELGAFGLGAERSAAPLHRLSGEADAIPPPLGEGDQPKAGGGGSASAEMAPGWRPSG